MSGLTTFLTTAVNCLRAGKGRDDNPIEVLSTDLIAPGFDIILVGVFVFVFTVVLDFATNFIAGFAFAFVLDFATNFFTTFGFADFARTVFDFKAFAFFALTFDFTGITHILSDDREGLASPVLLYCRARTRSFHADKFSHSL
jgi:hypothetical protein